MNISYLQVGTSAQHNWDLLKKAHPSDLWFHVQNTSSAYVILHRESITPTTVREAATLAKLHSKHKHYSRVKVIYCAVNNLKKGATVGEVIIKNQKCTKTLLV